ncbi:hypothetical protein B0H14DRAFT_3476497 [Mycena olivaceomarginata]|nr:hypothetical protein B0H14DRAFT_3476497 [Mycena olivaceomarginata]
MGASGAAANPPSIAKPVSLPATDTSMVDAVSIPLTVADPHEFPNLLAFLNTGRKICIHCATLDLVFRVYVYIWCLQPSTANKFCCVRMYHSRCPPAYNEETISLLDNDPQCQIIISTVAFTNGINVRKLLDSIFTGNATIISAHNYWLFFRPLVHHAQRALAVSVEGPDVLHSTPDTRKNIVSIVNSMWDTGIAAGMETIIAPNSTVYCTDCRLATVHHAKNISILFIWMKAVDIISSNRPKSAWYVVGFFIASDSPFRVTDLAFVLLRFQDLHIRDCDYQRFNLISLSYHICTNKNIAELMTKIQ